MQMKRLMKTSIAKLKQNLNPFSNYYARSFKLSLHSSVMLAFNQTLRNARSQKIISNNDFHKLVLFVKKYDVRSNLTILSQAILKSDNKANTDLLVLIKLLSLYTTINSKNKNELLQILKVKKVLKKVIEYYIDHFGKKWSDLATKLFASIVVFESTKQTVLNCQVDQVRQIYWNSHLFLASMLAEYFHNLNGTDYSVFNDVAIFEILQFEQSLYFYKNERYSLKNYINYNDLSQQVNLVYERIKKSVVNHHLPQFHLFLSHLNEISKYIRLSDLPPMTPSQIISLILSYLLLIGWAVIILVPLIQIVVLSFDGKGGNFLGTTNVLGDRGPWINYQILFTQTLFVNWLENSLIVAFATMFATVFFTFLLGYAFSRFRFPGRRSSIITVMLLQMIPSVAALTAFLVLFNLTNLPVLLYLIIIYTGGGLTGNTFILKGYLDSIPVDLDEAAKIDGSSTLRVFGSIIIPLAKPMLAIIALWSFIGPFGDVILPQLLVLGNRPEDYTMAAGLRTLIRGANPFQYVFLAGALITSIPLTILFIIAQKFLVSGLTKGAVK